MQRVLWLFSILVLTGCETTSPIDYRPSLMSVADAIDRIDRLTMSQRPEWRPDFIEINDQYILWGEGSLSRGSRNIPAFLGKTTTTTHEVGDRMYYDSPHRIVLSSWSGDHYVVSIRNEDTEFFKYVFRTKNQENAKRYVDALETLVSYYGAEPNSNVTIENAESANVGTDTTDDSDGRKDVYAELIKLDDLRKRGILTDAEFEAEKKRLLESR